MIDAITVQTRKMGGSTVVIIPSFYAKLNGIKAGDVVRLQVSRVDDGILQSS